MSSGLFLILRIARRNTIKRVDAKPKTAVRIRISASLSESMFARTSKHGNIAGREEEGTCAACEGDAGLYWRAVAGCHDSRLTMSKPRGAVSRLRHFHTLPEVNAELKSLQKRVAVAGGTSPQLSRGWLLVVSPTPQTRHFK